MAFRIRFGLSFLRGGMKKRNKKYIPKKVNLTAHLVAIQGVMLLSIKDQRDLFKSALCALNAMQYGVDVTTSDFTTLCDVINVSLLLTKRGIGREYLPELYKARDGMYRARCRYKETSRLGFDAEALTDIKEAFEVHQAQLEICTYKEFTDAFNTQDARIAKGETYKGNRVIA